MDLILEESVLNEGRRIIVDHNHYDRSYHFTNLMIDKALSLYLKDIIIFIKRIAFKAQNIPLSLRIFCLQIFRVVMEIVSAYKLFTTSV